MKLRKWRAVRYKAELSTPTPIGGRDDPGQVNWLFFVWRHGCEQPHLKRGMQSSTRSVADRLEEEGKGPEAANCLKYAFATSLSLFDCRFQYSALPPYLDKARLHVWPTEVTFNVRISSGCIRCLLISTQLYCCPTVRRASRISATTTEITLFM